METKICRICGEKPLTEFGKRKDSTDGYRNECKSCKKIIDHDHYIKNNKEIKKQTKEWALDNKGKVKNYKNKYSKNNPDKRKEYFENNKEKETARIKVWRLKNKEKRNKQERDRKINNPLYKLSHNVRNRINQYLKTNSILKTKRTFNIIGCSPDDLKKHLENQFIDDMCWGNYGLYGWHIDHIIPLKSAKTEDDLYKLCHYRNLQPLWANENLSKGSKISDAHESACL